MHQEENFSSSFSFYFSSFYFPPPLFFFTRLPFFLPISVSLIYSFEGYDKKWMQRISKETIVA
jgi:hypothetical protein